jgi:post-segregation antitoxin (ccd killing protein)
VAQRKNITIRDDQEEWIQDNHLNLSRFVQDALDEMIEERG